MKNLYLFVIGLLLVACAAESFVCPDGSVVENEGLCKNTEVPEPLPPDVRPEPEPEPEPELDLTISDTVVELKEKAAKVQGYAFMYAELPGNRATRKYFVRGDYARVELYLGTTRSKDSFDTVYLDILNKKAVGYCITGSAVICPDNTKIIDRPEFSDYDFELPQQFMAAVTNAEDAGSITYDDQSAKIFTTVKDDQNMRVTAHSYYGVPMKIEIFGSEDYVGEAGGYQFRDVAFNIVKEGDVTPPSGW
ncbi:hypothetical protein GOV10_00610 [Candidatus Woesearchaeota archaeon]|nr:hypothetical protein [Candidatus Woesearchaeota archaeon]